MAPLGFGLWLCMQLRVTNKFFSYLGMEDVKIIPVILLLQWLILLLPLFPFFLF